MSKTYKSTLIGSKRYLEYNPDSQPHLAVFREDGSFRSIVLSPADARDLARRILEDYPEPRYTVKETNSWWSVVDIDHNIVGDFSSISLTESVAKAQAERLARELNGE